MWERKNWFSVDFFKNSTQTLLYITQKSSNYGFKYGFYSNFWKNSTYSSFWLEKLNFGVLLHIKLNLRSVAQWSNILIWWDFSDIRRIRSNVFEWFGRFEKMLEYMRNYFLMNNNENSVEQCHDSEGSEHASIGNWGQKNRVDVKRIVVF